jgi:ribonucleotide reductase alpha subunit
MGCKGITVYRAGSRDKEVLVSGMGAEKTEQLSIIEVEVAVQALAKALPETLISNSFAPSDEQCCDNPFIIHENGCWTCKSCSFGKCDI